MKLKLSSITYSYITVWVSSMILPVSVYVNNYFKYQYEYVKKSKSENENKFYIGTSTYIDIQNK